MFESFSIFLGMGGLQYEVEHFWIWRCQRSQAESKPIVETGYTNVQQVRILFLLNNIKIHIIYIVSMFV